MQTLMFVLHMEFCELQPLFPSEVRLMKQRPLGCFNERKKKGFTALRYCPGNITLG